MMHVVCKKCATKIAVAGRPTGFTSLKNVGVQGNVHVGGGRISFGPGGSISFGPGGGIGLGGPQNSPFTCPACGATAEYASEEIKDD
jgi:hypothetical protein